MKTMKRKMSSARRRPGGGRSKPYGDRTKKEEERTTSDVPQKETSCSKAEAAAGCKSSSTRFPMRKGCTRPVEQEVLQREWQSLGTEEKAIRRAERARRGERCTECGCVGYFRRNCPTCPPVRYDVRKDRWRLLTMQEIEERTKLSKDRQFHAGADGGAPSITDGKASTTNTSRNTISESDGIHAHHVAGRGFLWGPLAEVAVNAAVPTTKTDAKSYGDGSSGSGAGTTTLVHAPAGGSTESSWHLRPGATFEGESLSSGGLGVGMAEAGVTILIPSLSGSSDLSSGVISEFRRALMRADGGAAWEACPSIVSSLNDIPGRGGEMAFTRLDPEFGGHQPNRPSFLSRDSRGTIAHGHQHADKNHDSPSRSSGMGGGDGVDESGGRAGGVGGVGMSCGSGVNVGRYGREKAAGIPGASDDENLVRHKLAWRWQALSTPVAADTAKSPPPALLASRSRGNGSGGDGDGGGADDAARDEHPNDGASRTICAAVPGATKSRRAGEQIRGTSLDRGAALPSPAPPPPPERCPGAVEATALSPPRKAPRGSYLRQRGTTVLTIQENLHLALERLAEAIREQARSVSSSRSSAGEMLRGPRGGEPPERYYEASTRKEFRDFFDNEEDETARRQQPKAYAYLGGLREVGKAKYVFDRTSHSHAEKGALAAHLRGDYEPQTKGYRGTNVHSVTDWRRPNTSLDRHAMSGRDAMELVAESDRTLESQGVWVRQQTKAREQRRQRANHMLEVYRSELRQEQLREIEILRLPPREQRLRASKTMQDQIAAADRIMRTIARYGLAGNMEDAHYITYSADAARRAGLTPDANAVRQPGGHDRRTEHLTGGKASANQATGNNADDGKGVSSGHAGQEGVPLADRNTSNGRKAERENLRHGNEEDSADDKMSPYSLALTRPLPAAVRPTSKARGPTSIVAAAASRPNQSLPAAAAGSDTLQSERLRTFRLAGHPLRRGIDSDTTAVPALIPIPEGLGDANGEHKSYAAGRIVEALRKSQVDSITGRRSKLAVPLWHRATEDLDSGAGSVLYSDLIGHTYSVLVGPKRTTEMRWHPTPGARL